VRAQIFVATESPTNGSSTGHLQQVKKGAAQRSPHAAPSGAEETFCEFPWDQLTRGFGSQEQTLLPLPKTLSLTGFGLFAKPESRAGMKQLATLPALSIRRAAQRFRENLDSPHRYLTTLKVVNTSERLLAGPS